MYFVICEFQRFFVLLNVTNVAPHDIPDSSYDLKELSFSFLHKLTHEGSPKEAPRKPPGKYTLEFWVFTNVFGFHKES